MPTSTKMFVEQSHLAMPSPVWLHVNGVSLSTDIHQYQPPVHTYDYRTKHLQSPVQPTTPPLISTPIPVPYSITMIDGPFSTNMNKQYKKLENTDMVKKFFLDRQIKKAKSLPGLIKGTALSRHTPLQATTFISPAPPNTLINNNQDDSLPIVTADNDDDCLPPPVTTERQNDHRRPRVYFADFNKIQIIEDNNDISPNIIHRRHRHRTSKRPSIATNTNQASTPLLQQSQSLSNHSRPISRQQYYQLGQELNIKKQQLLVSPRVHSSRITHLPDILNQTLPVEPSSYGNSDEKYILQREKPIIRLPRPVIDIPVASSMEISHNDVPRSLPVQDLNTHIQESESGNGGNGISLQGSSVLSLSSTNRQRSLLRTISLRQQFISPIKLKATGASPMINNNNHNQQMFNSTMQTRRSVSLKQSALGIHDENEDLHTNGPLLATETRPMTGPGSTKKLKRSHAIHISSKNPLGATDPNETHRHPLKSHPYESTEERFQNLLTVVRPPYATNNGGPSVTVNDSPTRTTHHHTNINGSIRSSRNASARGPIEFHNTSNTIIV